MRIQNGEVGTLPHGTPIWFVGTRNPEGQAPWHSTVKEGTAGFLEYGEWAAFLTEAAAWAWHYERLASWARAESARLLKVARDADKRARKVKP